MSSARFPSRLNGKWCAYSQVRYEGRGRSKARLHNWKAGWPWASLSSSLSFSCKMRANSGFSWGWDITVCVTCFVNVKALSPGRLLSLFLRAGWASWGLLTAPKTPVEGKSLQLASSNLWGLSKLLQPEVPCVTQPLLITTLASFKMRFCPSLAPNQALQVSDSFLRITDTQPRSTLSLGWRPSPGPSLPLITQSGFGLFFFCQFPSHGWTDRGNGKLGLNSSLLLDK